MSEDDRFPGKWGVYTDDANWVAQIRRRASAIRRRIARRPVNVQPFGTRSTKLTPAERRRRKRRISAEQKKIIVRIGLRRHAKQVSRRFITKKRGPRRINEGDAAMSFKLKSSRLLSDLVPNRDGIYSDTAYRRSKYGPRSLDVLRFSFTDNPVQTMDHLGKIAKEECKASSIRLNFLDNYCLDVGPYLLLAEMKKSMSKIFDGGDISIPVSKVLKAVNLDQQLDMDVPFREAHYTDVFPFPIRSRRPAGSSSSATRYIDEQASDKVSEQLIAAIDRWLSVTVGQVLGRGGRRNVLKLVSETLDNAERHGDFQEHENDGDWSVAGFMARRQGPTGEFFNRCHLAFLSTGATVADSIATCPEPTRTKLEEYVNRHRKSVGSKHTAEELLSTVFAMQDGVTRWAPAADRKTNGTGFQDILAFYSDLAAQGSEIAEATLSVISGRTCIHCKAPYMTGFRVSGDDSEREMWFNEENTPSLPPDASHVFELGHRLNGTLITMAFTLDVKYLENSIG